MEFLEDTHPKELGANDHTPCINHTCDDAKVTYYAEQSITTFLVIYIFVLFIGLVGNLLTISVILTQRARRRAINLYTFNLAVCDMLILCFYVPTQMSQIRNQLQWTMGEAACKAVNIVLSASITCTIATLVAITMDRARGLITPFKWRADSWKKAKLIVPCIWILSFIVNTPLFIYPKLEKKGSMLYCSEGWSEPRYGDIFWVAMFVVSFSIPLIVIATTYMLIIYIMRRSNHHVNQAYEHKMTRMGVALVVVFFVCTGFQHIFYFVFTFGSIPMSHQVTGILFGMSNLLVSLQAALNPFLYSNIHQDLLKSIRNKVRRLLEVGDSVASVMNHEIPRLSTYVVVKTNLYNDPEFDSLLEQNGGNPEVKVTLKVPTSTYRLSDITLTSSSSRKNSKRLSTSSIGAAIHYLMGMQSSRKLSMSVNISFVPTDDLDECQETTL